MSNSQLVYTPFFTVQYARAFFVVEPHESPLTAAERRYYPFQYARGAPAGTDFELVWYANVADADAQVDALTDTARLPTAQFFPSTPNVNGKPEELQTGEVLLTAPTENGYTNPVGVISVTQDTGTTQPRIYLLEDMLTIPTDTYTDHDFRYTLGDPPINAFDVEWYPTRLDAKRMINRLTDTNRLPRAEFFPIVPNKVPAAETLQNGRLRLYRPESDAPYSSAIGVLCVVQDEKEGTPIMKQITPCSPYPQRKVSRPNWEEQ